MSLIEEVASLRELEKQATSGTWQFSEEGWEYDSCVFSETGGIFYGIPDDYDVHLVVKLRNAAPGLLEVLAGFQPGDSEILENLLNYLESSRGNSNDIEYEDAEIATTRRLLYVARLMEANSK